LKSRVISTDSENSNEKFKNGTFSIIVTTNRKKDNINRQKLAKLLPDTREYICNSINRVTNLPGNHKVPEKLKEKPVVITTNHSKQKYREDGIVNGARGYVQAIQVSKQDPNKVETIWVIFNKEAAGRLYRFEHNYLRKDFNPGHELATPIFAQRKKFKMKFGNVEYQRTNFPLSLAYAITAHKCQGETLEEVLIDFGADIKNQIRNYICPGSFYVALTRVREGCKVFLRSFHSSYILVNKAIEEKMDAMRKFRKYSLKKVYLDEKIFDQDNCVMKIGYLNINGLGIGIHAHYLNSDHNLKNLDILVIAETKLDSSFAKDSLESSISNWEIIGRYDSEDGSKHMGLMILSKKTSSLIGQIQSITHQTLKRESLLQIQGLILRMTNSLKFGFLYCRSTPNNPEIKAIKKYFAECCVLMGDLNLSHRIDGDKLKIITLCGEDKFSALAEITRSISNNQLEYILLHKKHEEYFFATSFHNFISDHKSITVRLGLNGNKLTNEIREKITFDKDSHGKSKKAQEPAYLKKAQEPGKSKKAQEPGKSKKAQEPGKSKKAQEPGKPNKAHEPMECDGSSTA
jgi:hypothetical protein